MAIRYKLWVTLECVNEDTGEAIEMVLPVRLTDTGDAEQAAAKLRAVIRDHADDPNYEILPAGYNPFFPPV